MNEADTRANLIDPALKTAGWNEVEGSKILRELVIAPGRIEGSGKKRSLVKADYVLLYRNHQLAIVEAKSDEFSVTEGVGQAKDYAQKMSVRFTYATNGKGIYEIDMETGAEREVPCYPTPQELWERTFAVQNAWRDLFAAVAPHDKGGMYDGRFYQTAAIEKSLEAIAAGKDRILLTLATGTGKTMIAFQIAWKLFHSRWNLSREPNRLPRILFLADRNILANQAFNGFSGFEEDALIRITPEDIKKKGKVPKNASIFFTIFQTFMSGPVVDGEPTPYFGDYPPDFFDFIVIDECHRGGAKDEGNWRKIMEYFKPAVQLGLTATPKRKDNVDTYKYFGEPVYTYSLKDGINDGYLTPFKVKQISTTLDEYVFTQDDVLLAGDVEQGKRYTEAEFNRKIEIIERERARVKIFMEDIDQNEKSLVFCANQAHASLVRDLVNQVKTSTDPRYCVRVTADEGELGDLALRDFQDNEKMIPTILTTSQKLSTGVDARNIRNIVLMRPIKSMIEFKQIIGRGTRLFDGKDYFTIYDFVKAHHHFSDPEWDGEPMEPPVTDVNPLPPQPPDDNKEPKVDAEPKRQKALIKLADGKERTIQHMMSTTFWHPDGTPMSAQQFMESLYGHLPELFKSEEELRRIWSAPDTRSRLLAGLAEKGFGEEQLEEMQAIIDAEKSDLFDVLAHVAFARAPIERTIRAEQARGAIRSEFSAKQQEFLDFVLGQYVAVGVGELSTEKLAPLLNLKYQHSIRDAVSDLGTPDSIAAAFSGFQRHLYNASAA
jgi:type I restriction enzyme, R subunit